jgi:hypothetical protein
MERRRGYIPEQTLARWDYLKVPEVLKLFAIHPGQVHTYAEPFGRGHGIEMRIANDLNDLTPSSIWETVPLEVWDDTPG